MRRLAHFTLGQIHDALLHIVAVHSIIIGYMVLASHQPNLKEECKRKFSFETVQMKAP